MPPVRSVALAAFALAGVGLFVALLPAQAPADIVLRPGSGADVKGAWSFVSDTTAAGGRAVRHVDTATAKLAAPLVSPTNYFELTFSAAAGTRYRLWLRGRAQADSGINDSVFVQFTNTVDGSGSPKYRIGTTSAYEVNLEECSGCGLAGWGWQDTGWGRGVLGPEVVFASGGTQTIRVQTREDGLRIDQIVLSPERFLTSAPGALTNDTTIVPAPGASVSVVRGPYLQQMRGNSVRVVWATKESGTPSVRLVSGATTRTVTGQSRLVSNARSSLGFDYYHHEVTVGSLTPGTSHTYQAFTADAPVGPSAGFRTPAPSADVSFIAFGDSGTGSTQQRQLAALMGSDSFDLALHAGDIVYGNSGGTGDATFRTYGEWFFDVYASWLPHRPFFPVEGNHDSRPSNGDGVAYLEVFSLPSNGEAPAYPALDERYYSFDYGRVHFVMLDTEYAFQDAGRRAQQLSWLESDLAATTQPWKVAVFHRSPYSAGGEHGSDLAVRAAFVPVLEQYGVRLVISAHEHTYERTRPLRQSASAAPVTYVVTGGGGGPLYPSGTADWTAYSASRHHYVKGDVTECTLTLNAVGLSGAVFDSTTITRCEEPAPPAAEVILFASDVSGRFGKWALEADSTAAAGQRIRHPNASAAKLAAPLSQPADYFEASFDAVAGVPYRLWMRGKADANEWSNDSVFVQFDSSADASGTQRFRIGTTSATEVNLEDCSGCGLSGWGWQDNGWGVGVRGPAIYFTQTGRQRLRVQTREDGLAIDQIVLSPSRYLTSAPGALKNDTTILTRP